jgi:hypothetical protein
MSSPLTVFGIDFTSAPKARKPITCVRMSLDGRDIEFEALEKKYQALEIEVVRLQERENSESRRLDVFMVDVNNRISLMNQHINRFCKR